MAEIRILWALPAPGGGSWYGGDIKEIEDWKAESLVSNGYAEYTSGPEDEDGEFDNNLADELERLDSAEVGLDDESDFEADDFDSDFDDEEPEFEPRPKKVKKPRTVDPKSKWLEYAKARGYTGDDTITKNRLIAEYGE